ncbi:hypothetical protein SARC_08419 [Sphaeroforma arctica JP610]|uniref:1-phosphatidylinositol 4-kinase n=1 Tax=Sphaeroforma arctica JP610 TaxID=667725 RepID=A0A0L0FR77_9EUKA|nr:hypothetical protein SARC_08419 [Sphaeroforma arctica JP610]KNC79184.1 hypothetical protein SARC_08419 [Sphaeroforma arctica JP610]|eukprot:XP_014153086.1 hypothetical protein SARC_08419 [Sphaeroforma arctica JP610]
MGDAMDVMICERFIPMKSQSVRRVILYDDVVKLKEPWEIKRERVRTASPYGHLRNWNVLSVIVKSGDDLRQDVLASQLLLQFELIWKTEKVDLWLRPVRAMITSNNSGIIETIHDAISIHSIKKHNNGSLYEYFVQEYGPVGCPRWNKAQYNFIQSMAAYSLVAYFLQIKDRHNGNIMLTRDGHLVHIDFGYFISSSPRNMGFESAPFKLTTEFVQVMGGVDSPGYRKFRDLLFIGFVTAKKHMENILVLVDIMQKGSDLPCFVAGLECRRLMKERFFHSETEHNLKLLVNGLVDRSLDAMSTVLYDNYQYYTNGIL